MNTARVVRSGLIYILYYHYTEQPSISIDNRLVCQNHIRLGSQAADSDYGFGKWRDNKKEVEMATGKKIHPVVIWLGVALLQLIMTQVVTFLFSFLIPEVENFQRTHPVLFAALLGVTFSQGVFLPGWLALRFRWEKAKPLYPARLAGSCCSHRLN